MFNTCSCALILNASIIFCFQISMNVLVNTAVSTDATTLMVALSASVKLGLNLTALDTHAKVRKCCQ